MSATPSNENAESIRQDIFRAMEGRRDDERAQRIYRALTTGWGMQETIIEEGGRMGVPTSRHQQRALDDPDFVSERYGDGNIFLRGVAAGPRYQDDDSVSVRTLDEAVNERAIIDESVVGAASPVEVDPRIVDVQRSVAQVLGVIQSVAQPGFTAQYNIIDSRDDPVGFLSESEAVDLSSETPQGFSLTTDTKDMIIQVSLINVSDFAQRAEDSLNYMDLRQTTVGQAVIAHTLQKAKGTFYGDTSVAAGDQSVEDADAFDGLAKMADDAGNSTDKSAVSSGFLEDLLDVLTTKVQNTGLTWDRAHFLVSPQFYNAVYNQATPVIRLAGYDADVEYGPQGIALSSEMGSVPITPCSNIRTYAGLTGVGASSDPGDVFLIDDMAIQYRQLAPMFTVPLGRVGLADRAAMAEYYTLIDKSQGNHLEWLQGYDI